MPRMCKGGKKEVNNKTERLCADISRLEPLEFVGILHLMGVSLTDENQKPRPFNEVIVDMTDLFETLTTRKQKEILKLVKSIGKKS